MIQTFARSSKQKFRSLNHRQIIQNSTEPTSAGEWYFLQELATLMLFKKPPFTTGKSLTVKQLSLLYNSLLT